MAKVVTAYSAVMTNTSYIYDRPDDDGEKTQYDYGTELRLHRNYAERETNGYYPVIYPENGWIEYWVVGEIEPIYETVTDACTAPESLTIAGKTMTINGGAGGDLNMLTGFGVSWRERAITGNEWSAWSADEVTESRAVDVTANAGKVRQYRARTLGSAGAEYYSGYTICETLVNGNTAAKTPTIVLPRNNAMTISQTPVVVVSCPADAEGDAMVLKRRIDSGAWTDVASVTGGGGTVYDRLPAQAIGGHQIFYRLVDQNDAASDMAKIYLVFSGMEWGRTIASGDIISNKAISHINDIEEMLYAVNTQRRYYELPVITLPGSVGKFADWGRQMKTMFDSVNACLVAAGRTVPSGNISQEWPNADTINLIRNRVKMI